MLGVFYERVDLEESLKKIVDIIERRGRGGVGWGGKMKEEFFFPTLLSRNKAP